MQFLNFSTKCLTSYSLAVGLKYDKHKQTEYPENKCYSKLKSTMKKFQRNL